MEGGRCTNYLRYGETGYSIRILPSSFWSFPSPAHESQEAVMFKSCQMRSKETIDEREAKGGHHRQVHVYPVKEEDVEIMGGLHCFVFHIRKVKKIPSLLRRKRLKTLVPCFSRDQRCAHVRHLTISVMGHHCGFNSVQVSDDPRLERTSVVDLNEK